MAVRGHYDCYPTIVTLQVRFSEPCSEQCNRAPQALALTQIAYCLASPYNIAQAHC